MQEYRFEYGPLARGSYYALIALTALVLYLFPEKILHYLLFLLFLGFGLRPLIERTGLYELYQSIIGNLSDRLWKKRNEKARRAVGRKVRDEKLRKSRLKDPSLPRNW